MYIADLHCDSLLTVNAERGLINGYNFSKDNPQLQLVAAFVPRGEMSAEERRRRLMHYVDVYIAETARLNTVRVEECRDLAFAQTVEQRATVLSVEGGGGLFCDSDELITLHKMGMRVLGLAWDSNELASGCWDGRDTGLTDEGRALVRRCSEMGIIMDVSHLSDLSFEQLMDTTAYPVIATHSNFREVTDSPRNLTRPQAEKLVSRGGIIGLNLYPGYLSSTGRAGAEDILRHVDYALEHFGDRALALGLDIDGFEGGYPEGFDESDSIHDRLVELLLRHYSADVVERIAGLNAIDFFKSNL